jgi:hypothetical protein
MPLGDSYGGHCAADAAALIPIDTLRRCCNLGYARAVCQRAAGIDADATGFLIKSDHDGVIEVAWSLERNHHPLATGNVQITAATPASDDPLARQAAALVTTYTRWMGGAR